MTACLFTIACAASMILLAQLDTRAQTDFSTAFPEIPGCTRTIYRLVQSGAVSSQQAGYGTHNKTCGVITIQVMPGLKKLREQWPARLNVRKSKIRDFDVWHSASWCGVPTPVRHLDVYLSDNAMLSFSQYGESSDEILNFARRADYIKLRRLVLAITSKSL